ncbi:hypothetical protein ACJRO7_001800 [Eucalyptus globulus]|uniref:CAAX prenyl protease 2/Lysostaphin resistance protein A-like domain-containing protein n=1 Tax=Eucalyptus globulus TaxID=34317 RepID=A0ABD3LS74_EUCGL
MMLVHPPRAYPNPIILCRDLGKFLTASPSPCPLLLPSQLRPSASPKRRCSKNENTHEESFQGFPALPSDGPWDSESVWSTFAFYLLSLHIPLSFGGLSVVAHVLHRPVLDPQTEALSLFGIQVFEFFGTLCLLKSTAKPQYKLISLFKGNRLSNGTKTWVASALGFCSLIFLVFLTSFLADRVIGPKAVNNLILKEILLSSDISRAACVLVYCIITPLLEEIVYRGFLLTSISSTSKWQQAVLLSSAIFSAVHFSGENSLQLFVIGCVLGCSYCWSGDLSTSFLIHSLYNALILVITYAS